MQTKRDYQKYNLQKGEVFGRLTLTGNTYFRNDKSGRRTRMVTCECECGTIRDFSLDLLKRGETKSCGCFKSELLKANPNQKTHGLSKHPLYTVWDGMKQRCYNPKASNYCDYGAKGITITSLWKDDFKAFYDWAIVNGWEKGLTIDRKNGKLNYEPSNCWFITYAEQRRNMSDNIWIECWGEKKLAVDWAADPRCVVSYGGLRNRLGRDKDKWPDIEKAMTTPAISREDSVHKKLDLDATFITAFEISKSINEWLKDERCVADVDNIKNRRKKGWDGERIITTKVRAERQPK